jgi:hypothetical protein
MEDMNERMRELERRSRAAFDASVESLPGEARSRLARARAKALEELRHRRLSGAAAWVPAGAAAAALAAALLWPREDGVAPVARESATLAFDDLELFVEGEDFDMLREDEDFVAWAAAESADGVG